MPANLENSEWPQDWKRSVFIPIPKKGNTKECSNYHTIALISHSSKFSSVAQSCLTLCDSMDHSTPGLSDRHQLPEFTQTHVHQVGDAIQPSHPLPLLPSIFPSIRVFSNELVLHIRWPKYWSFSFNISPSKEHSGLISFRMGWLDLFESKGLSRVFSNTTVQKHQFFGTQLSL